MALILPHDYIKDENCRMIKYSPSDWRHGLYVEGTWYAVDFTNYGDGGLYANVRKQWHPTKGIWKTDGSGEEEFIHHSNNVSGFWVEANNVCRRPKKDKETTLKGENKNFDDWHFWAKLMIEKYQKSLEVSA